MPVDKENPQRQLHQNSGNPLRGFVKFVRSQDFRNGVKCFPNSFAVLGGCP